MLDVEGDGAHAGVAARDDQVHQVLQRLQRVASPADEQAKVVATDVDDSPDHSEAVARRERLADGELRVDVENAEEVIDDVSGEIDIFGVDIGDDVRLFFAWPALGPGRSRAAFGRAAGSTPGPLFGTGLAGGGRAVAGSPDEILGG